jgi:hypothetical protein
MPHDRQASRRERERVFNTRRQQRATITPAQPEERKRFFDPVTDFVGGAVTGAQGLFRGIQDAPSAGIEHLARTVVGPQGPQPQLGGVNPLIELQIETNQSRIAEIQREILDAPDSAFLTPELRQAREEARAQAEADIGQLNDQIDTFNAQLEGVQETFEVGNQFLEAMGLPTTVSAAREDPEINAGLNAITTALASGDPDKLDAAIDKLASVGEDQLDDLGEAFGRDRYLSDLQRSIRTQLHNLVENRQQVENNLIAAEDYIALEAQAQANPLWDMDIDPTPGGMGGSTVINHMESWLEGAFNGVMSPDQFTEAANVMLGIWRSLPSEEVVEEEGPPKKDAFGNVIEPGIMTDMAKAQIEELAGILGFTPEKAQDMVEAMNDALELGVTARTNADGWKTLDTLSNVSLGMAAGSVALEIYDDPEIASQIANSWYLHRLIQVRSNGSTARVEGKGNQFGLGNLPEHTYESLGYTVSSLEDNSELQMEALLYFIGKKYGPGYEGLATAYSDLVHNPDGWGDLD